MTPQDRRKIALFLPDLSMGGAERVFITVARMLVQRGHNITLILGIKRGPLVAEIDPLVQVVDLASIREGESLWRSGFRTVFSLRRYLRRNPTDSLLSTLTGGNLVALLSWLLAGRPCFLVIREAVSLANIRSRYRKMLLRWFYPLADRVIVLNDVMKSELRELGIPVEKLVVINNPVDEARIRSMSVQPLSDLLDSPYIIAIGRLVEQKDFVTLIHAFAQLEHCNDLKLVILGEGPQRGMLEQLIDELGLVEKVFLLGLVANPYPWLKSASGFVLSSRWEGYPNVLLEAQCFCLPMVVTEYDSSIKCLLAGQPSGSCQIVPVGDVLGMSVAIKDMLDYVGNKNDRVHTASLDTVDQYEKILRGDD